MKASLAPLTGKYYGTIVLIEDEQFGSPNPLPKITEIEIWIGCTPTNPSIRELANFGITQEQWNKNEQVGNWPSVIPDYCDGEPDAPIMARDVLNIHDSHYEDVKSYDAAMKLVDFINTELKDA